MEALRGGGPSVAAGELSAKSEPINLRIVARSLVIRDAYPRTIERQVSIHLVSLLFGKCRLQVTTMSMTPAKATERTREEIGGRGHVRVTTATPVTAGASAASLREMRGRAKTSTSQDSPKTHRRQRCATVLNNPGTAQPSVARSVKGNLASYDTTAGEQPSAQRNARTVSRSVERMTADSCLVFRPLSGDRGENRAAVTRRGSDRPDSGNLHRAAPNTVTGFASGGAT
jgi:hypothetical protein